jgi:endogenous inhibitor of DNA gyrase (YacG/DUF329 family)
MLRCPRNRVNFKLGTASILGVRMGSKASNLPIVRCPGCGEPMDAKAILPATEELDDIVCVCPRCGAETKRTVKRGRSSGKQPILSQQ